MTPTLLLAALLSGQAPAAPPGPPACKMGRVAELPVTFENNQPVIPAQINDQPVRALLDTGAGLSLLFRPAADRLGLKTDEIGEIAGVDGKTKVYQAHVRSLGLMGQSSKPLDLAVTPAGGRTIDMLIGRDILMRTDIELDLGKGQMRLLRPFHCTDEQMAYWSDQYSEARLIADEGDEIRIRVRVNGVYVTAIIDSGAQSTIVSEGIAFQADVPLAAPRKGDVATGVAGRPLLVRRGVVKSLEIGDETLSNATLRFGPIYARSEVHGRLETASPVQMLLGADFLKAHRVFVVHETGKVYFTYNGGPIFRAEPAAASSTTPPPTDPAPKS
jgi:predicted aspartyl protease